MTSPKKVCAGGYIVQGLNIFTVDEVLVSLGAFFWEYSGIVSLEIDGIRVLLGAIPFSE